MRVFFDERLVRTKKQKTTALANSRKKRADWWSKKLKRELPSISRGWTDVSKPYYQSAIFFSLRKIFILRLIYWEHV